MVADVSSLSDEFAILCPGFVVLCGEALVAGSLPFFKNLNHFII